ncbi:Galacturonokinase [Platanthera zijinensis]|uniref:Galacturonokinase n=1 Tax=Platanthera zijinensis TaxID=2320716 RepID=A0AAP0AT64_9ASPA
MVLRARVDIRKGVDIILRSELKPLPFIGINQRMEEIQVKFWVSERSIRFRISHYYVCGIGVHICGKKVIEQAINLGVSLEFVPRNEVPVQLSSGRYASQICIRVLNILSYRRTGAAINEIDLNVGGLKEEFRWLRVAKIAKTALNGDQNSLVVCQVLDIDHSIGGFLGGSPGGRSGSLSEGAAVGIAYLLSLESANNLYLSPSENIELDKFLMELGNLWVRALKAKYGLPIDMINFALAHEHKLIENAYLGLRNGILDQAAILLSKYGYLTLMNCKTKEHTFVCSSSMLHWNKGFDGANQHKILLAFSGAKHCLRDNPGYNCRVAECQEAAEILLCASDVESEEPRLCDVDLCIYEAHKHKLKANLAKRAEHFFSENERVIEGVKAWSSGNLVEFGKLISASGLSSINNYECGCEPMIQLYEILLRAPGVFGARFSGAGFRGCCLSFVDGSQAEEAAVFVQDEYSKAQPELVSQLPGGRVVILCEAGDSATVI